MGNGEPMPHACQIDPARRLGTATLAGNVSAAEFARTMEALYGHPRWEPGFRALWDGTGITQLLIAPDDLPVIEASYRRVESSMGRGRAAFVVPYDVAEIIAHLLIHRLRNADRERRTFGDVDEALAWLDAA